jgi:hypothetical protein
MKVFFCVLAVFFLSILSCENQKSKEKRLAVQHCGSCHAFPEASLLDKQTWDKEVLPEMAFRMGLSNSQLNSISFEDQAAILRSLPGSPMVSSQNWERIRQYYIDNAPDSLISPDQTISDTVRLFEVTPIPLSMTHRQAVTLIKHDSINDKIYVGNRPGKLYALDLEFAVRDSFQLKSAPSKLITRSDDELLILQMGIMDPNEQALGSINLFENRERKFHDVMDSLQRPVDFEVSDLNNDGISDYVVCNFGNYTGSLIAYKAIGNGKFYPYVLQHLPGARRIIIRDFDGNGLPDILALMTQGDERIVAFYNQGNFQFRMTTLLRFDAVYGSSYFDVADFNGDGKFDIVYTNGDNADYSAILKPYHGVRIYLNSGTNEFKESWFYPMHGASQARVADFDKDEDLDIAAISFFPDFRNHPELGFIYFENTPDGFIPQITPLASKGRWITMELADIDRDGDSDLLLGSLAFPNQVPQDLLKLWRRDEVTLLLLRNALK